MCERKSANESLPGSNKARALSTCASAVLRQGSVSKRSVVVVEPSNRVSATSRSSQCPDPSPATRSALSARRLKRISPFSKTYWRMSTSSPPGP